MGIGPLVLSDTGKSPLSKIIMKIFRVLGLGLAIIILRSLLPSVFQAFENTLLAFFHLAGSVLGTAQGLLNSLPVSP